LALVPPGGWPGRGLAVGNEQKLIRVVTVKPYLEPRRHYSSIIYMPVGLKLELEDGRVFTMYAVPPEVIEAIIMIERNDPPPRRQSLFTFLAYNESFKDLLDVVLEKVVIDEFDPNTGLYTATVHLESDGLSLAVKMIPSHAVYLALVGGKPVYVTEDLVEISMRDQEELSDLLGDLDVDDLEDDEEE